MNYHPDILRALGFNPDAPAIEPIKDPSATFGVADDSAVMLAAMSYAAARGLNVSVVLDSRPFLFAGLVDLNQRATVAEALRWRVVKYSPEAADFVPAENWARATTAWERPQPSRDDVMALFVKYDHRLQGLMRAKQTGEVVREIARLKAELAKFPDWNQNPNGLLAPQQNSTAPIFHGGRRV